MLCGTGLGGIGLGGPGSGGPGTGGPRLRNSLSIIIRTKGQTLLKWNMAIKVRKLSSKKLNLVGKLVGIPEIVIDRDDSVQI